MWLTQRLAAAERVRGWLSAGGDSDRHKALWVLWWRWHEASGVNLAPEAHPDLSDEAIGRLARDGTRRALTRWPAWRPWAASTPASRANRPMTPAERYRPRAPMSDRREPTAEDLAEMRDQALGNVDFEPTGDQLREVCRREPPAARAGHGVVPGTTRRSATSCAPR